VKQVLKFKYIFLIIIAIVLRFVFFDIRPFHNDEGVNFHFIKRTVDLGYYPYSHQNYHGPLYFYILTFFTQIFGYSIFGMKISSILLGIVLSMVPLFFKKVLDKSTLFLMMLFLAFSPELIFHSNYIIHEMLLVLSMSLVYFLNFQYIKTGLKKYLFLMMFFLAFAFSTKETVIISMFALTVANLLVFDFKKLLSIFIPTISCFLLITIPVSLIIYTAGGFWYDGAIEFAKSFKQWIDRGVEDSGHFKSFYYYLEIVFGGKVISELGVKTFSKTTIGINYSFIVMFLVSLYSLVKIKFKRSEDNKLFIYFFILFILHFLIYSYIPYKTPWLIINISTPLIFCFALSLRYFSKKEVVLISSLVVLLNINDIYKANYKYTDSKLNPLYYTHTSLSFLTFLQDLEDYVNNLDKKPKIAMAVNNPWPIPYYLRDYAVGYIGKNAKIDIENYDIVAVDSNKVYKVDNYNKVYYRFSDVTESHVYFKKQKK